MSYITTKLTPLKSYPTYQFYAQADSKTIPSNEIFKICILETFKWLRSRLKNCPDLPNEILTPEPDKYADFSDSTLTSFTYSNGFSIDVIYIEKKGIWSFKISESDMGANIGQAQERLPVHGRMFNTEISFIRHSNYVEIGIRTICSEPSDTTADCEVFRPMLVRSLVHNENIRLIQSGYIINEKPFMIQSKNDVERFYDIYDDLSFNFPLILIADSKTHVKNPQISDVSVLKPTLDIKTISSSSVINSGVSSEINSFVFKTELPFYEENCKKEKRISKRAEKIEPVKIKLPVFDYTELARVLVGFAVVVFVDEKYFKQIEKKIQSEFDYGDIVIIRRKSIIERFSYSDYNSDMKVFFSKLRSDIISMPKRKNYTFGEVLFYSDAKIEDYRGRRNETTSLEDQCNLCLLENAELKKRIRELSEYHNDMQQTAEELRIAKKKIDSLQQEVTAKENAYNDVLCKNEQKESAYRKNAELISFYKQQIEIASRFPINKDDVCDWIEENFHEHLTLSPRARSEMKKYSGALDIAILCDGIVFLKAYSEFRRKEISDDEFNMYAQRNNWEVQSSGKEAIKIRKSDYTMTYEGRQYILDLHIKHGVKSEELIRVYFCWDDDLRKVIIGSMPGHLATVKQST
ncbi:MAG: hypothetical protein E7510_09430 [Ruminococcus sp.]|nr:hypothetical protein [Ruminococcus sp.]